MGYKLSERTMLVQVRQRMWQGKKTDRAVSDEIATLKNADKDAGTYVKNIIGRRWLKPISSTFQYARLRNYDMTFPYDESGWRLLASQMWQEHIRIMNQLKSEAEEQIEHLLDNLPAIREASLLSLGEMAEEYFPTVEEARDRFEFRISYRPTPDHSNWVLDLDQEIIDELREDTRNEMQAIYDGAVLDTLEKIKDSVGQMAEKLRAYKPSSGNDKATVAFKQPMIDNMRSLIATLPALNFTDNPKIEEATNDLKHLVTLDAKDLKEDAEARRLMAERAAQIYSKVEGWMTA